MLEDEGGLDLEGAKYNLIYEYYKYHILFGHLKRGEYMPKIEQICNTFRAVPHTARRALKKLKDDSLIYVSPGRNTIITYTAVPEEMQRFTKEYYLSRKNAISQVYMIANLLLMPIYQEGIRRLTDAEKCKDGCRKYTNIADYSRGYFL